jgi:hypothetical protein
MIAPHPYSVAFMLGRRAQLGIDPSALLVALDAVTAGDLRRVGAQWFGEGRGSAVVVRITGARQDAAPPPPPPPVP